MRSLIFLVFPLLSAGGQQHCPAPTNVAKALYESAYSFAYTNDGRDLLDSPFREAVAAEVDCLSKEGLCSLDYDPWLGAQDGTISGAPRYTIVSEVPDRFVVVQFSYRFVIADQHAPHAAQIVMHRQADGCWKVSDFITPIGDSLLHMFSRPK